MSLKELVKRRDYLLPGSSACSGCGLMIALKIFLKILGQRTILVIPASCAGVLSGNYPRASFQVITINTAFETAASLASGVSAALEMRRIDDVQVLAWAGDGATFDIGLQALSNAAQGNENILYVCDDNESYMNTGIQSSGATPYGAWTTTTPLGKRTHKKNIMGIMLAHKIPYLASASPSFPVDLMKKVSKAKDIQGTRFIHLLVPCPTGWRFSPSLTIKIGRLAVETGMWILYEYHKGHMMLTGASRYIAEGKLKKKPIEEYLSLQGRFNQASSEETTEIQRWVDSKWEELKALVDASPPT
ncbi:MAG: pyruvate synthase subunit beta [Nitrososphaeria archaeon]|nr:pyruvate synthase subunit beta [Nitrososphaeria archaeon]NIN53016.1 pyruvate synthase subunit beta [Nitrososphaeria archaeon]NIQ33575.1 pyruvate synthase subunit beta [Nitrososphaeria archaeon]